MYCIKHTHTLTVKLEQSSLLVALFSKCTRALTYDSFKRDLVRTKRDLLLTRALT